MANLSTNGVSSSLSFTQSLIRKLRSISKSLFFSFKITWRSSAGYFMLRVGFELIGAVVPIVMAYVGRNIINTLVASLQATSASGELISRLLKLLVIILIVQFAFLLIQKINEMVTSAHKDLVVNYLNMQIVKKSAIIDLHFFDSPKFQNEIMNARSDSQALQSMTWIPLNIIRSAIQLFATLPILIKLHWAFPLILILLKVPSMIMEKKYTYFTYNWSRNRAPEERKMAYILGILTARQFAKDLRLFDLFNEMLDKYTSLWEKWFSEKRAIEYARGKWVALCNALPQLGNVMVSFYLGVEIIRKRLTIGDYSFYSGMSAQFAGAINNLISAVTQLYDSELKISNYLNFLEWDTSLVKGGSLEPPKYPVIEFRNVTYRYPDTDKNVLENLSFTIHPGENVALVGLNGAGKTTLIKLIMRFYDPVEGQILFDGTDIREYDLDKFRKLFTAVFQDYSVYAFTARENITFSEICNASNDVQVSEACRISSVDKISVKWKDGLDTFLTKQFEVNGEELSGGERQKIAIARGFFRKSASIIVLDEPSSNLDAETEHKIFTSLAEICKGKTAIFISHRLSSVTMVDKIIVLENGKIIEEGTHQDLIKVDGRYAYLFNLQAKAYRV